MTLRLGALQYPISHVAGLDDYAVKLDQLAAEGVAGGGELLLMPEYACMEVAAAFAVTGPEAERDAVCGVAADLLSIMQAAAVRHRVWLAPGSVPQAVEGRIVNRAPLIRPDGLMAFQDKQVMTRFEAEQWGIYGGAPAGVFETPWGRLGIAVCYDSEFPGVVRAMTEAGAWLILVPTCTDTAHGYNRVRLSCRARALENQCFVALSPTVGEAPWLATLDRNTGRAGVYGPVDRGFPDDGVIVEGDGAGWVFADLDPARLEAVRRDGAVLNFQDWPSGWRGPAAKPIPFA
ncbi:MAG TPA: carbon-nitrogen hydrolase family protein [Acetobacteraceae bacterium]